MILLKLLGAWGWLKQAIGALLDLIRRYPLAAALIASLCLSMWLWRGWSAEQAARKDDALAHSEEMKAWRAASEQARKDQLALNAANQELSQRIADNAAQRHVETKRATDRAIADYAASHRMRADSACRPVAAGEAPMHPDPGTPAGPDGSELVAVPRADFEAVARDAVRGREAQAFLIDLVNGGLAVVVPEPEFGKPSTQ